MDFLSSALFLLLTLAFVKLLRMILGINNKHGNLPPGPKRFPVIGNLLALGNKPHKSLAELAKIYGPIMSLKLGQISTVVISSPAVAKQIHQKQDLAFCNRWLPSTSYINDHHKHSVVLLPVSDRWRSLRKILTSSIFSGCKLDYQRVLRRKKVEELVSFVGRHCGEGGAAVNLRRAAFATSINMLSNIMFSVDLTDLTEGSPLQDLMRKIVMEADKPNWSDFFPFLAMFDPQGILKRSTLLISKLHDIVGQMVEQRSSLRKSARSTFSPEKYLIDVLLSLEENNELDRKQVQHSCMEILLVGSDATSVAIEWIMGELLHNPKALAKAKEELEQTVGRGTLVDEADVAHLPYLRAVIREVLRLHPSLPLLIPRTVETDVNVCGYTIPKGSQVIVNAWAIGRDPEVWVNPDMFMPERFLESDIDVYGQDFELIPFGAGRRICPGMYMATRMISVMVGSLINSFDWMLDGGVAAEELDMEDKFGFLLEKAKPLRIVPLCM